MIVRKWHTPAVRLAEIIARKQNFKNASYALASDQAHAKCPPVFTVFATTFQKSVSHREKQD